MILGPSWNKPDRSPSSPAPFPATLKSWQGLPNVMMSTGSIRPPWISVTLPRWSMLGKCRFETWMGNGSISLAHTGVMPFRWAARGKADMPSNRLPSFKLIPSLQPTPAWRPVVAIKHFRLPHRYSAATGVFKLDKIIQRHVSEVDWIFFQLTTPIIGCYF